MIKKTAAITVTAICIFLAGCGSHKSPAGVIDAPAPAATPAAPACVPGTVNFTDFAMNCGYKGVSRTAVANSQAEYEALFSPGSSLRLYAPAEPSPTYVPIDFSKKTLIAVRGGYSCGPYSLTLTNITTDCRAATVNLDEKIPCGACYEIVINWQIIVLADKINGPVNFNITTGCFGAPTPTPAQ